LTNHNQLFFSHSSVIGLLLLTSDLWLMAYCRKPLMYYVLCKSLCPSLYVFVCAMYFKGSTTISSSSSGWGCKSKKLTNHNRM